MTNFGALFFSIVPLLTFVGGAFISVALVALPKQKTLTIGFMGDVMLGRIMNNVIEQKGYRYPWGNLLQELHQTDLNIANLETTFTKSTAAVPKVFNFKSDPKNVKVLQGGRIDVVTLANNHSGDFGDQGLLDTIQTLDNVHIAHVGAGKNSQVAQKPVILEKKGIKIGIIGATDNEPGWAASTDKPGVNYFDIADVQDLVSQIKKLKQHVDIIIVTLHWGPNMRERPTQAYKDEAHALVEAGADIIQGHSAHIFQGIEIYKGALIMYDTGDFINDYRVDPLLRNDRSFLFLVTIDKTGVTQLKLIPVLIDNFQVNHATGQDAQWSLKRIQKLSSELGATVTTDGTWRK